MELFVNPVTYLRSKLKFFKSRQAIFIYVATFYLLFMLLHKPNFVPGAEFSNNKERLNSNIRQYISPHNPYSQYQGRGE